MEKTMNNIFQKIAKPHSFHIEIEDSTTLQEFRKICNDFEEFFEVKTDPG